MKLRLTLIVLAAACASAPTSDADTRPPLADSSSSSISPAGATLALVDVRVVAMDGPTAREHQTVLVHDGRIETIAASGSVSIPANAFVVRGNGTLTVMPGLTDMHVHMFDRDEMLLYIANGVTAVRHMHGLARHLAWKDSVNQGLLLGPRLFVSGPILDGDPPTRSTNIVVRTPDEARQTVASQIAAGFDFIKIYDNVSLGVYAAINDEARKLGKKVVGHIPTPVGLEAATSTIGQQGVEHAEELLPFFNDGRTTAGLNEAATRFAASGIWFDPTIDVYDSALRQSSRWATLNARPEMQYVNPATRATWGWDATAQSRSGVSGTIARYERTREFFVKQILPAFHAAGVKLLAGSDAPIPALVPGFSLLDELDLLRESGLTPYEVLQTTTTNPAEFLGEQTRLGPLATNRLADLLVVEGNPLENLGALRKRRGVIVGGRWYGATVLQAKLDSLKAVYQSH